MTNEFLNIPNESTLDINFEDPKEKKSEFQYIENQVEVESNEKVTDISSSNVISDELNDEKNKLNNDIDTTTDCLALTIRKNYHIVVVKNFFKKSFRVSWKVALGMFTINFLNLFL